MRERYLDVFDRIWIDNLNGDKYKTGKLTPAGEPDPSVFSTEFNPEGIQVGTAIALLVRRGPDAGTGMVEFRHLWGKTKRASLLASRDQPDDRLYQTIHPMLELGLPFMPTAVQADYLSWPLLPELFPVSYPGVNTSRDLDLVEIDYSVLEHRMALYFDPSLSDEAIRQVAPSIMTASKRYDPISTRRQLLQRGINSGILLRYCYRPFDVRYLYWHPETKLLDEKREDLYALVNKDRLFLTSRQKAERGVEGTPFFVTRFLADRHLTRPGSALFPLSIQNTGSQQTSYFSPTAVSPYTFTANLSPTARAYLASLGITDPDADAEAAGLIWMHVLAIGYSPAYLTENADGIRQDWPRIPLPGTRQALLASAELGRQVAALLDPETPVPGVTTGAIRPELLRIGTIARLGGGQINIAAGDLRVTAGWGHAGKGDVTMPGKGRVTERHYIEDEQAALAAGAAALGLAPEVAIQHLGAATRDIWLNDLACWRNIPERVWDYTIGGYQVIKKWLSYREAALLGRSLTLDEAREVTNIARRIAALRLLEPGLDANYRRVVRDEG